MWLGPGLSSSPVSLPKQQQGDAVSMGAQGTDPWAGHERLPASSLQTGRTASPENGSGYIGSEKVTCPPVTARGVGGPGLKAQP